MKKIFSFILFLSAATGAQCSDPAETAALAELMSLCNAYIEAQTPHKKVDAQNVLINFLENYLHNPLPRTKELSALCVQHKDLLNIIFTNNIMTFTEEWI